MYRRTHVSIKQNETGADVGDGLGCWGIMAIIAVIVLIFGFGYLILV